MMELSVPIIDISFWLVTPKDGISSEQTEIARLWNEALQEFGCAIIVGHGISEHIFEKLNEECSEFFANGIEDKQLYNHGMYGHPLGGYSAPGKEIVALSCAEDDSQPAKFDPVENFVFTFEPKYYCSPTGLKAPIESAQNYYMLMHGVLNTIHSISCAALGISDIHYFEKYYDNGKNGNALRLAHYPPLNAASLRPSGGCSSTETDAPAERKQFDESVRYGAHTDYQGFTLLRPDKADWHCMEVHADAARDANAQQQTPPDHSNVNVNVNVFDRLLQQPDPSLNSSRSRVKVLNGGLEVFHRASQQWIRVKIPPHLNALVVNAGDLIQRWTNDTWSSPLHRVVVATATATSAAATIGAATIGAADTAGARADAGADRDFSPPSDASAQLVLPSHTTSDDAAQHNSVPAENTGNCSSQNTTISSESYSRQAIVFFSGPVDDCIVDSTQLPATSLSCGRNAPAKYPPIRSIDHLLQKLNRTNNN